MNGKIPVTPEREVSLCGCNTDDGLSHKEQQVQPESREWAKVDEVGCRCKIFSLCDR